MWSVAALVIKGGKNTLLMRFCYQCTRSDPDLSSCRFLQDVLLFAVFFQQISMDGITFRC